MFVITNVSDSSNLTLTDENDYWHHFGAPSTRALTANAVTVVLIMFASVVLNGGTLYVFLRNHKLNPVLRRYIICLSISDLVSPLTTYWMNVVATVNGGWPFGDVGCTFYGVVQGYCAFVSITTVAVMSVERLQAMRPGRVMPLTRYLIYIVWIYPLLAVLPPVFGWSRYSLTGIMNTCCFDFVKTDWATRSFVLYISMYGFFIPVIVTCLCYGHLALAVRRRSLVLRESSALSRSLVSSTDTTPIANDQRSIQMKRLRNQMKPIRVMKLVFGAFLIAWTPYALAAYIAQFGPPYTISPIMMTVLSVIAKSNTFVNPIIYMYTDRAFRRRVCHYLGCPETEVSSSSSKLKPELRFEPVGR